MGSKGAGGSEAQKYVWEGAIPLQIHLHESEVTTLPPPPPALILAPRIGYLPLLGTKIKPFFSNSLPPGVDTIWFEYKGLPLKWYIPTGVLFDLLCAEPERPWNLTVHFRGYPGNILTPCEGEDSAKWSFINSLKEAAYVINGNCKNVMNMSQPDQLELWRSIMDGRIPVRLYVRTINEDFDDLQDAPAVESWDKISYINRPVEIHGDGGKCFTLCDAITKLLPELFGEKLLPKDDVSGEEVEVGQRLSLEETNKSSTGQSGEMLNERIVSCSVSDGAEIKLIRIQGIEPKMEIPFAWVVNNLMNPDYFLHICVYVKIQEPITI
uniref:Autophagy protein 5 n=1 Tax=Nicotiana tabacum TaxID=4097 RepID=A0A1S4BPX7_TOBAC|nr:PREDICTED: autophagy protein 5 isoform X2 [Nicotiana tabacum]